MAEQEECGWSCELADYYETDCGKTFVVENGTPSENDMIYCCFCGKRINEKEQATEETLEYIVE